MRIIAAVAAVAALVVVGCSSGSDSDAAKPKPVTTPKATASIRPDPTNYLANASFELGLKYWRPYAKSRLGRTRTQRKAGQAAAMAMTPAGDLAPYGASAPGVVGYPEQRDTYEFSVWVKADPTTVGKRAWIQINESGGRFADSAIARTSTTLNGRWRRIVVRGRVRRPDRAMLSVFVYSADSIARGDRFYIDDARLIRVPPRRR